MPIIFISKTKAPLPWIRALKKLDPSLDIRIHGQDEHPEDIDFALAWNHPAGAFELYPNLKVICSMGAGVDHLFRDPNLPKQAKICRIVDEELATAMNEFLLALIMNQLRGLNVYKQDQSLKKWTPRPYLLIQDIRIGIMGLGQLGQSLAKNLVTFGFKVCGWSNSKKNIPEVISYAGHSGFPEFLNQTDILICLLPLTDETKGILNKETFVQLPKGAFIINVARGDHLVESDLIEMIDNDHLRGAALDVFSEEPLPQEHPFWTHPKIHITPHIASITKPESVAPQILKNYQRMKAGLALLNEVSREKGY